MYWGKYDILQIVLTFINYYLDCGDNMHCHVIQLFIQLKKKTLNICSKLGCFFFFYSNNICLTAFIQITKGAWGVNGSVLLPINDF